VSGSVRANTAKSEKAGPEINISPGKTRSGELISNRRGINRNKGAAPVNGPLEPTVRYFHREENSTRPQYAEDLPKRPLLLLAGAQMVQDQNGDRRRKTFRRKGQSRSIALQNATIAEERARRQIRGKSVAVLETGDASRPPP
jgi:hypothetical protein